MVILGVRGARPAARDGRGDRGLEWPRSIRSKSNRTPTSWRRPASLTRPSLLYQQVVEDNPRDWNIINKIGDLYAKLNKFEDAADYYAKVADFYAKDGFHLKADRDLEEDQQARRDRPRVPT